MNITVTARHITLSDKQKEYARKKIKKLENYFQQLINARVVLHVEKMDHFADVIINGDGVQFHGREKAADFYSAIDLLFEKMEKQVVRYKEKHSSHKVEKQNSILPMDYDVTESLQVRLNQVSNKPVDKIEAFLEMKVNGDNFILFKQGIDEVDSNIDFSNKNYAAIFLNGGSYKFIEIPKESFNNGTIDNFKEYEIDVIDDSITNPNLNFKEMSSKTVKSVSLEEALKHLEKEKHDYFPFFNSESQYLNIVYTNGKELEVMVPAF